MKTTKKTLVIREFGVEDIYNEIEKMIDFKHPFTLSSDKDKVEYFQLMYETTEVIDDSFGNALADAITND